MLTNEPQNAPFRAFRDNLKTKVAIVPGDIFVAY